MQNRLLLLAVTLITLISHGVLAESLQVNNYEKDYTNMITIEAESFDYLEENLFSFFENNGVNKENHMWLKRSMASLFSMDAQETEHFLKKPDQYSRIWLRLKVFTQSDVTQITEMKFSASGGNIWCIRESLVKQIEPIYDAAANLRQYDCVDDALIILIRNDGEADVLSALNKARLQCSMQYAINDEYTVNEQVAIETSAVSRRINYTQGSALFIIEEIAAVHQKMDELENADASNLSLFGVSDIGEADYSYVAFGGVCQTENNSMLDISFELPPNDADRCMLAGFCVDASSGLNDVAQFQQRSFRILVLVKNELMDSILKGDLRPTFIADFSTEGFGAIDENDGVSIVGPRFREAVRYGHLFDSTSN